MRLTGTDVHVYQKDNPTVDIEILFKDYLRIDIKAMKEYEKLKLRFAKEYGNAPSSYSSSKSDIYTKTLDKAREYFHRR